MHVLEFNNDTILKTLPAAANLVSQKDEAFWSGFYFGSHYSYYHKSLPDGELINVLSDEYSRIQWNDSVKYSLFNAKVNSLISSKEIASQH